MSVRGVDFGTLIAIHACTRPPQEVLVVVYANHKSFLSMLSANAISKLISVYTTLTQQCVVQYCISVICLKKHVFACKLAGKLA